MHKTRLILYLDVGNMCELFSKMKITPPVPWLCLFWDLKKKSAYKWDCSNLISNQLTRIPHGDHLYAIGKKFCSGNLYLIYKKNQQKMLEISKLQQQTNVQKYVQLFDELLTLKKVSKVSFWISETFYFPNDIIYIDHCAIVAGRKRGDQCRGSKQQKKLWNRNMMAKEICDHVSLTWIRTFF